MNKESGRPPPDRFDMLVQALFVGPVKDGQFNTVHSLLGASADLSVTVGTTSVPLVLDSTVASKQIERERQGYGFMARGPKDKMRLSIAHRWSGEKLGPSWEDEQRKLLERRLREIAAAIIVFGHQTVRDGAFHAHGWRIKRKAELAMRRHGPDGTEHNPDAYVFGNESGERVVSIRTAWKLTCERAAICGLHFHDLRREFASRLLESRADLHDVQMFLGHADITTTSRYLQSTPVRLERALARLEEAAAIVDASQESTPEPPAEAPASSEPISPSSLN